MNLIDRDYAIFQVNCAINEAITKEEKLQFQRFRDFLRVLPHVDAAPVAHGLWKERARHERYPSGREYKQSYCSVCNMSAKEETPFCPNCGASME